MQASKYWAIEVWGGMMGSYRYYIEDQQARAAQDNAPLDAIYKHHDESGWMTASELPEPRRSEVMRWQPSELDPGNRPNYDPL